MRAALHGPGLFAEWLRARTDGHGGEHPEAFDADATARFVAKLGVLFGAGRYFDLSVRGLEHVPAAPTMLISNHSGGSTIPDAWGFGVLWYEHFLRARPLHVLAHDFLFGTHASARFFERRGVLRATGEVARAVLTEHRRDLLVFPGGDLEVWRPYRERFRVNFAGHLGYARVAIETQTPIVPIAHAGAHETLYVITDGSELARRLGVRKLIQAHIWPVHVSLPWGLGVGPLPHIPLPARFRYLFGQPIAPPTSRDEGAVRALGTEVVARIQAMLDQLRDEG